MHENSLETLPLEIKKLKNLKYLNLALNNISSIPENISSMSNLEYFDISFNNLTDLPESLSSMKNLRKLIIFGNRIPAEKIARLKSIMTKCKIIGEEQNTYLYKNFTDRKMITDTLRGIIFKYPEEYKVDCNFPNEFCHDTSIVISKSKVVRADYFNDSLGTDDTTAYYTDRACTVSIRVTKDDFMYNAASCSIMENESIISGDKSLKDYYEYDNLWISTGRHNHEAPLSAINLNNWKGLFGSVEWLSYIYNGLDKSEDDDDVHDFFTSIAYKRMGNGRSIFVSLFTDMDTEEDL